MSFQRILIEDNGRFGLIWTAAFRPNKLTKVDVLHIDISQKCREILEFVDVDTTRRGGGARPRFSLFISSHLMKGLCVLLQKKNHYIYEDALHARALLHPHRVPVVEFEPILGKSPIKRAKKQLQLDTTGTKTAKQITFGENLPILLDTDAPLDRFVIENELTTGMMITLPDMIETRLIQVEMEQEDLVPMDLGMLDSMMMMFPEHNAEVTIRQDESKQETGRTARQSLAVRFDATSILEHEQPPMAEEIQQPPVLFQDTFMDIGGEATMQPVPEIPQPPPLEESIQAPLEEQEAGITMTRARARRVRHPARLIIDQALEITQEDMVGRMRRSHRGEMEERMDELRRDHRLKCQHDFLTTNLLAQPLSRGTMIEPRLAKYSLDAMMAQWSSETRNEARRRAREAAAATYIEEAAPAPLPTESISVAREQGRETSQFERESIQQPALGMESVSRLREGIAPILEAPELLAPMDTMMDFQIPPALEQTLPEERIEPLVEATTIELAPVEPEVDFERIILNALNTRTRRRGHIILQDLCQTHQLPDKCKKRTKPRRDFYTRIFAATLELCKSNKVSAQQTSFYGPIKLELKL